MSEQRYEALAFDIDLELYGSNIAGNLEQYVYEQDGLYLLPVDVLFSMLRAAWGHGYTLGATEVPRGQFGEAHGYQMKGRPRAS